MGCRQATDPVSSDAVQIDVAFEPEELRIGESTLLITITDAAGNPIPDATINVRGDMSHPGMQPVIRDVEGGDENGVYTVPFEWTMAGDWIVEVNVTLDDGTEAGERFEYTLAGDMDMDAMDMTEEASMDDMEMATEEASE
jgi:hypothetical protein